VNKLATHLLVIIRWRKLIFWNTVILTVLAAGISFILPQKFTAVAQLLPPSAENDMFGLSGILGGGISSVSGLRSSVLGKTTPSDLMLGILNSGTVMSSVAVRCSIAQYAHVRGGGREQAVRSLREMTSLSSGEEGIVRIAVEARDRQLAARIANAFIAELDTFLRNSNISRGRNMRLFVQHRLAQVESTLRVTSDSLRVFQEHNKVVALDEETKAAIDAYAKMKSDLSAREAELEVAQTTANDDNPYVVSIRNEIRAYRDRLDKFEYGGSVGGFGAGFAVPLLKLPSVTAEFVRRYEEYRIQEESYASLYQQYEYAQILEARDVPALTVLDYASPPERRSHPRRSVIVLAALVFGAAMGLVVTFLSEYFSVLRETRQDEYAAWANLASQLSALVRRRKHVLPSQRS
jgi:tyrosine-protein kinase Etk/Wzc